MSLNSEGVPRLASSSERDGFTQKGVKGQKTSGTPSHREAACSTPEASLAAGDHPKKGGVFSGGMKRVVM